jgi:maleate isomerase
MYGTRARIGYTSPVLVSEIFAYEFYRVVPEGVTLAITTLSVWEHTGDELDRSYERTMLAARAMAEAGLDLIVLGGVPVLASKGHANAAAFVAELEAGLGVPVTTAPAAYEAAFAHSGAKKVVCADVPHSPGVGLAETTYRIVDRRGSGRAPMVASTRMDPATLASLGRELVADNPAADTLWLAWPHRSTVDLIEPLERELGISVMSSAQAIIWESLRRCGISEPIDGFGRLLAEPR